MSSSNTLRSPRTGLLRPGEARLWPFASRSRPRSGPPGDDFNEPDLADAGTEEPAFVEPDSRRPPMDWTPVALCVALGLGVIVQFVLPWSEPLPPPSTPAPHRSLPVAIPAPGQYPVILGAPIFSPDRKPGEDTGSAPGASALDAYSALGVATGRGLATALVKGPGAGPQLIRPGQELEGWKLIGLDRQKLTFERNGARHVLAIGAGATPANAAQSDSDE